MNNSPKTIQIQTAIEPHETSRISFVAANKKLYDFVKYISLLLNVGFGFFSHESFTGFVLEAANLISNLPSHYDPTRTGTPISERIRLSNKVTVIATTPRPGELLLTAKFFAEALETAHIAILVNNATDDIIYVEA